MPSPFSLPLHALRLAGKCALPLIMWFSVGEAARFGLLYLGTEISHGDYRQARLVATIAVMTLVVMLAMAITTGMLHSLRGALWETAARGGESERYWVALDRIAPAFAAIYLTWNFVRRDAQDFISLDWLHNLDQNFYNPILTGVAEGKEAETTAGAGLSDLDWRVSLASMAVAMGLRWFFNRMVERGEGKVAGVAAALSEFALFFFGLNATMTLASLRADWVGHRQVVAESGELWKQAKENVPGWESFWTALGEIRPYLVDALIVPLTWLTIAILVFGAFSEEARTAVRGVRRLEEGVDRLEQSHTITQNSFNRVTGSFMERWVPLVNTFRLVIKGGAALFGMMCLFYVALRLGADYADRGVRTLIGSETPYWWLVISEPIEFVKNLLVTTLTMCLLAATFDIAATRARRSGQAINA
ncbi:hypothetical protein GCM10010412_079120 [Nonomuraea recticatena]|uniref:ABC transmembrane type-1 domain-containing protein n=2 Tax=Nonomuraea recticatena TaxID=46178 RepID=A0ABN3T099_9ACTN